MAATASSICTGTGHSHDGGAPIANFRVEVRKSGENWPTSSETLATTQAELNLAALAGTDGNGAIDVALPTGGACHQDWQHDASAGDDDATGVLQYRVFAQTALTGAPARRSNPSGMATEAVNAGNSFAVPTGLGLVNGTSTEESQNCRSLGQRLPVTPAPVIALTMRKQAPAPRSGSELGRSTTDLRQIALRARRALAMRLWLLAITATGSRVREAGQPGSRGDLKLAGSDGTDTARYHRSRCAAEPDGQCRQCRPDALT